MRKTAPSNPQKPKVRYGSELERSTTREQVVLYKNGVGYFEHKGKVRGDQQFGIEFTTVQLNDVLKSLTLVDLNGGAINAVRYNSVALLDDQLKDLQIPLSEEVTSAAFRSPRHPRSGSCCLNHRQRQSLQHRNCREGGSPNWTPW